MRRVAQRSMLATLLTPTIFALKRPHSTAAARQNRLAGIAASTESLVLVSQSARDVGSSSSSWIRLGIDGSIEVRSQFDSEDANALQQHGPFPADSAQMVARTLSRLPAACALLGSEDDAAEDGIASAIAASADEVRAALSGVRAGRRRVDSLHRLQSFLGLPHSPSRIESFDVSHMGGEYTVVSCASVVDAAEAPAQHLRWPVRDAPASDDCAALTEGLFRRYGRGSGGGGGGGGGRGRGGTKERGDRLPDLILIDGGKGQLGAARRALAQTPARNVPLIALAKGNETVYTIGSEAVASGGYNGLPSTSLVVGAATPDAEDGPGYALEPPPGGAESSAMLLLRLARDAAHRTALEGHRHLREAAALSSALTQLETRGVGATRRAALLDHFGSFGALCAATPDELRVVPGIGKRLAESLSATLSDLRLSAPPQEDPPELPSARVRDDALTSDEVAPSRATARRRAVAPLRLPTDPVWPPLSPTAAAIARPRKGRRPDATRTRRGSSDGQGDAAAQRDGRMLSEALRSALERLRGRGEKTAAEVETAGGAAEAAVGAEAADQLLVPEAVVKAASEAMKHVGDDAVEAARAARRVAFEGEKGGGGGAPVAGFGNRRPRSSRPFELVSPWPPSEEQAAVVDMLKDSLDSGARRLVLKGATGTGKTYAMSQLIERVGKPTLLLAPNKVLAVQLWSELVSFFPHNAVEYFVSYYDYYRPESYAPVADVYLQKSASVNEDIDRMRHAATAALRSRSDTIVVASVSCIYGLGAPELYQSAALSLEVGETLPSLGALTTRLAELQYVRKQGGGTSSKRAGPARGEFVLERRGGGETADGVEVWAGEAPGADEEGAGEVTVGEDGYNLVVHPIGSEHRLVVQLGRAAGDEASPHALEVLSVEEVREAVTPAGAFDQSAGNAEGGRGTITEEPMAVAEIAVADAVATVAAKREAAAAAAAAAAADDIDEPSPSQSSSFPSSLSPTSTSTTALDSLLLFPASHHVLPEAERARVICDIRDELAERLVELRATGRAAEAERLAERVTADLEDFVQKGYCKGLENYSRHLCGRPAHSAPSTLLDFFPSGDFLLLVDESHVALPQLRAMHPADQKRKRSLVEHGFRLPSALDNRPLSHDEFWERVPQAVFVSATPGRFEMACCEDADQPAQTRPSLRAEAAEVAAKTAKEAYLAAAAGSPLSPSMPPPSLPTELVLRPTGILDPRVEVRPRGSQLDDLIAEASQRARRGERTLATVLTRVGAERLAETLEEHGLRAAYMHSGTKPLDRVRVLRSLRNGELDVLVGVNLLREGLDLPEVSLVAVLDADKEGFLRSITSLVQTIGRAARHVDGTALLYADRVTNSMDVAMHETNRRRAIQRAHNARHGITPRPVVRSGAGSDLMLDLLDEAKRRRKKDGEEAKVTGKVKPTASELSAQPGASAPPVWLQDSQLEQQPAVVLDAAADLEDFGP